MIVEAHDGGLQGYGVSRSNVCASHLVLSDLGGSVG